MIGKRIIPCLDVRDGRVVKGTNFEGVRDVADPVAMARRYNESCADGQGNEYLGCHGGQHVGEQRPSVA